MKEPIYMPSAHTAEVIERRSPAGRIDSVQGWHNLLKKMLHQMVPYLREGHLITFRRIEEQERVFFEKLSQSISVPNAVGAIYRPPSVRYQMMNASFGPTARSG